MVNLRFKLRASMSCLLDRLEQAGEGGRLAKKEAGGDSVGRGEDEGDDVGG